MAFIGPHANTTIELLGNDYNSDNLVVRQNSALLAAKRASIPVSYSPGCADLACMSTEGFDSAITAAKEAEVAVVFLGLSQDFEREGHDRTDIDLPGSQLALARAVLDAQPNTVIVLVHGGIVAIDDIIDAPAILTAFYGGEMAGPAMINTLIGANNPGGKLPYTWYPKGFKSRRPNMSNQDLRSGDGITYRYYKGPTPLFEFGHGLSYTSFKYAWVKSPPSTTTTSDILANGIGGNVSIKVTNVGDVEGDAVVLAFLQTSTAGCPKKSIFDFERVTLKSRASATVSIWLPSVQRFACVDDDGSRVILPGSYTWAVEDISVQMQVTGSATKAPTW